MAQARRLFLPISEGSAAGIDLLSFPPTPSFFFLFFSSRLLDPSIRLPEPGTPGPSHVSPQATGSGRQAFPLKRLEIPLFALQKPGRGRRGEGRTEQKKKGSLLTGDLRLGNHVRAESFRSIELPELRAAPRLVATFSPGRTGRGDTQ